MFYLIVLLELASVSCFLYVSSEPPFYGLSRHICRLRAGYIYCLILIHITLFFKIFYSAAPTSSTAGSGSVFFIICFILKQLDFYNFIHFNPLIYTEHLELIMMRYHSLHLHIFELL